MFLSSVENVNAICNHRKSMRKMHVQRGAHEKPKNFANWFSGLFKKKKHS